MFHFVSTLTPCPWDEARQLLYLTLSAKKVDMKNVPPGNFVFLIDASGSMDQSNRLPLIKAAFRLFVNHLRPTDTVSIVTYGGDAMVWLSPTSGANKSRIMDAIESLEAEGDTPGESAIKLAYKMARASFIKGGINRVIIATDGDFNVGETSEKALEDLVSREKAAGIYLTCLGVGIGNLKDSKLQVMAKKGNGNYVYLDDIKEAEKVFMRELTQTICMVADNATAAIQFNPNVVSGYRLIGFDNEKEDLASGEAKLEGGQVGSASSTILIYELETKSANTAMGNLTLSYQLPNDTKLISENYAINSSLTPATALHPDFKFINTITMFGLRIKKSAGSKTKDWKFITGYWQNSGITTNHFIAEFNKMMVKASKLYPDKKKRKRFLFF
jgi:Ca-activated chloride channel family protein